MSSGPLDHAILNHHGGVSNNSLLNILDHDPDLDSNETETIRHSPYYDFDMLQEVLQEKKNRFSILSSNIQAINAKYTELKIFIEQLQV